MTTRIKWLILLLMLATSASASQDQVVAIKAARILPITREPIEAGIILVEGGRIVALGPEIEVPDGATLIDAAKYVAMPGLVDARAFRPVRGDRNEQSDEITPAFDISLALDPKDKELKRRPQSGITTLYVSPGGNNVIAGLGAVIKPVGRLASDMIVKDEAALHITMGSDSTRGNRIPRRNRPDSFYYRRPTTRMAVAWMLRKSFFDAQQYAVSREQDDPEMDVLVAALQGSVPVRIAVRRAIDIRTAFRIADEYKLRIILDECTEGYKVAGLIAEKQAPVVLGPFYFYPRSSSQFYEGREFNWNNAGILTDAGVKVALASGGETQTVDLLSAAVFAVRHGMSREQALKAITLTPAEILGVADQVGSLDEGKDADILILSGDPLASTTRLEYVILNGRMVYRATQ